MPIHVIPLESGDIIMELRKRGFGIDSCHGYAFRLAVRSKENIRKSTGLGNFEPVGGPTIGQLREIQRTCQNVKEAADRVEDISFGRTQTVAESTGKETNMAAVLYAVDNRIDAKLAPIQEALGAIVKMLDGSAAAPAAVRPADIPAPPPRKPRGRPRKIAQPQPAANDVTDDGESSN